MDGIINLDVSDGQSVSSWHESRGKRAFDIVLGTTLFVVTAPLFVALPIAIALSSRDRPCYRQKRRGRAGRPFSILKFRTMVRGADEVASSLFREQVPRGVGLRLPNDPRVSRLGRFLRSHSLDELPQLINVIRGEMSLVGPRPFSYHVFEHADRSVPRFDEWEELRHECRPGMTGLWQVSGRNNLPAHALVRLDLEYVESASFLRDLRILIKTLPCVLSRKGAY